MTTKFVHQQIILKALASHCWYHFRVVSCKYITSSLAFRLISARGQDLRQTT